MSGNELFLGLFYISVAENAFSDKNNIVDKMKVGKHLFFVSKIRKTLLFASQKKT